MNRVCLDTSAYGHFKRGHGEAVRVVSGAREVGIPAIVLGELRAAFRLGGHRDRNDQELQTFLAESSVRVLEVDDEAATIYADIVVELRRAGAPLPTNDIWIAALASREGMVVVTYDDHFRRIFRVGTHVIPK